MVVPQHPAKPLTTANFTFAATDFFRLLAAAQEAPPEWAQRIRELAQPQIDRSAHAHEWLFPVIALAVLAAVLLAISRRYRHPAGAAS